MRLALGSVQFGLPYGVDKSRNAIVNQDVVQKILDTCRRNNIDTIDTAMSYGVSEATLGSCGVNDFNIVTKLPAVPQEVVDVESWIRAEVSASLNKLGVQHLHAILLHKPSQLRDSSGVGRHIIRSLELLKKESIVNKIGVSIYSPEELNWLDEIFRFDIVQAPFNVFDSRLHDSGWLDRLKLKNVEVHARSIFLQGLLLVPIDQMPAKFMKWRKQFFEWHKWLASHSISPEQGCLLYLQKFAFDRVVIGVRSVDELNIAIESISKPDPPSYPVFGDNDIELINPSLWK